MKFIEAGKPDVEVVGYTVVDEAAMDRWVKRQGYADGFHSDAESDTDALAEFGGRVCYMSFEKSKQRPPAEGKTINDTYLNHVIEVGHGSVLEHGVWNFAIAGVDRNLTHELVRHRVGVGYSQLSTRYVAPTTLVVPSRVFNAGGDVLAGWLSRAKAQFEAYQDMMGDEKKKDLREDAMAQLPGSIETKLLFSANGRALRHIFLARGALGAKKDIRALAVRLFDLVGKDHVFFGIEKHLDPEKGYFLMNKFPKV